jgi:anaerobic dimethyl sulfoxide reductase subunit B (iron-sulfur subunit)
MSQYAFYFDTNKCVNCKSCAISCKEKHNHIPGRKFRRVHSVSTGNWVVIDEANRLYEPTNVFSYSLSIACNHCADPACKKVCPAGAIAKREDGIVFIDWDLCIGCGSCASACPYNAPSLDKEVLKMDKCDFCRELLPTGEDPMCVAACSVRAIEYGDLENLRIKHPNAVQRVEPLPDPSQTGPSLLVEPHRKSTNNMVATLFNMPEELQANEI